MAIGADVANLIVSLRLDDKGFTGKLNAAAGQLKAMDTGLAQMGRGAGQMAGGIGKLATATGALAVGGLAAVVTTAASFEQAWAGVRKTVDGSDRELADLEEEFKQLSRTVPLSFEELAAIGAEGGALGIAREDLVDFTDVVARLAVSTDLSAEQAASSLGILSNVLGLQDEQLRDFADSLVALGNDGASTESQIIDLATRFGAAGRQAGLSNEAILALASTTASMGIEAEAGGGALSRIFNGITLDIGTATEESQVLADAMNMSLGELRTAWDRDAGKVFEDLLGYINDLDKFQQAEFLKNLGITNVRDINAISLLAAGVDEYGRQLAVSTGQTDELNRESDAFFNTTEGKWEILKNNVRLAADTIGGELLPVVNEVMGDFVEWLSDPKVQAGLKDFAGDLSEGLSGLIREIKDADFGPLLDTMKGAAGIAKAGFDAFNALPSGVKAVALAALGVNKLTGGALSDIAKGFGNILGGALKLSFGRGMTPATPMFVKEVGLGGAAGAGAGAAGAGRAATGAGALRFLGPLIVAAIADEFSEEIEGLGQSLHSELGFDADWNPLAGFNVNDLQWPFGNKNAPSWAAFENPPKVWNNDPLPKPAGGGPAGTTGTSEWARGLDGVKTSIENGTSAWAQGLNELKTEVATLPDTAMVAPGMTALTTNLMPIRTKAEQQLAMQSQALAAARGTNSAVGALARVPHNVTVDNHITIPVNVNTQVVQQQIYRLRMNTGSGGFI